LPAYPAIDWRDHPRKLKIERSRIYRRLRRYDLRFRLILVRQGRIVIFLGNHPRIPQSLLPGECHFLKLLVRFGLL
jgi:hypothetical protein